MACEIGGGGGPLPGFLPSAAPAPPCPMESHPHQTRLSSARTRPTKRPPIGWFSCGWRRRESNPRPQALRLRLYMLIRSIYLIAGYPTGRENRQRAWQGFNESAPGALHRDPIWGDSRDPVVWARSRAEGFTQVFKLLKRSCRRWQLKFCNQFNELSAARHAPRVSLPTSKPGRPHEVISATHLTPARCLASPV